MKTIIQENLIIRVIKIFISFSFLFFLLISKKKDESKVFIILCTIFYIVSFLVCFISAFQKIEITNEKVIKSFIIPVKIIDRKQIIDMNLQEKKDGTYNIVFTMKNSRVSIFHVGAFFSINDIIKCLNNEHSTEISEISRKDREKVKTVFYAKILLCLVVSILVAFFSIIVIGRSMYLNNIYIEKAILVVCFGIIFIGVLILLLKILIK